METIINKLTGILGNAFLECGYDSLYGKTAVSNRPDLCQFQCNGAMIGAKVYKKSPMQIAGEVIEKLDKSFFDKVEIAPPGFINITLKDEAIFGFISEKDAVGKAYSKAHSVKLNLKLWEYIGWIPRYIELFSEAKAGIKNIQDVCVRCFIFQSAHDELVSRKSERYIPKKENIKLKTLENSAHFIYDSEDEKLFLDLFTKLLSSN